MPLGVIPGVLGILTYRDATTAEKIWRQAKVRAGWIYRRTRYDTIHHVVATPFSVWGSLEWPVLVILEARAA